MVEQTHNFSSLEVGHASKTRKERSKEKGNKGGGVKEKRDVRRGEGREGRGGRRGAEEPLRYLADMASYFSALSVRESSPKLLHQNLVTKEMKG